MPSITTSDGFTFNNWGPVTTTFTPPASCATATNNMRIGLKNTDFFWPYADQCSTVGYYNCIPTGTVQVTTTMDPNPQHVMDLSYFSPGLNCPAGFNTVGLASRGSDSSLSASGLFATTAPTAAPEPGETNMAQWQDPMSLFLGLLDAGETAFACCPTSMKANILGCYSTVPDYKVTTGCYREMPSGDLGTTIQTRIEHGTTVHQAVHAVTGTLPITETKSVTFDASETSSLVGISVFPIITLVHHQSDMQVAATATGSATGSGATATTSNAAGRIAVGSSVWDGFMGLVVVWVPAMSLGAAIVFAW